MIFFSCQKEATKEDVIKYASTITQDELKEHLYIYASDEFEGRDTGEPGQKKAVEYLKKEYEKLGIGPVIEGNYFQNVPLNEVSTPKVNISANGKSFNYYDDFISLSSAESGKVDATEIVFAGYGIDDEKYSDYTDLNVAGKIVVVKNGEPKDKSGNNVITGDKKASKWSNGRQAIYAKRDAAKENGAKTLFFVDDNLFKTYSRLFKRREESGHSNRLSLPPKKDAEANMYFFLISEKMGKTLVKNISKTTKPATIATKFEMDFQTSTTPKPSENVAAIIKGSEKPDEYIVISSHLDHEAKAGQGHSYLFSLVLHELIFL